MANAQTQNDRGYFPVNEVDIPPQALVWLELVFKPPLSIKDFVDQWGAFKVTIIYEGAEKPYDHEFDQNFVQAKLRQQIPAAFGPRVTHREP